MRHRTKFKPHRNAQYPHNEAEKRRTRPLPTNAISSTYVEGLIRSGELPGTPALLKGNIERYVGMVHLPVGLAGPVLIHGTHAKGDFYVPMATTEGALVASYSRGMKAIRRSGGCHVLCRGGHVQRSPFFRFHSLSDAAVFATKVAEELSILRQIVRQESRFAELENINSRIEGDTVTLLLEYKTGDAAGQNMVTLCSEAICRYLIQRISPKPIRWYLESNFSGDKKATAYSLVNGRGREVHAEISIPKEVVYDLLKSSPERIVRYWQTSTLATIRSGAIGSVGHVSNALTAIFTACGQDIACAAESSIGILRMEHRENRELYASLSLPSLIVGTVGGGTSLPTQRECLRILDCAGTGKADKFAEIVAATALAGELSIAAAMAEGHFAEAHRRLGRKN